MKENISTKPSLEGLKESVISGDLANFSLGDLLQMLASKPERHEVEIVFSQGVGTIWLEGEMLCAAEIDGPEKKEGLEALRELLALEEGHFEVRSPEHWPTEGNLQGPVQALLIEAIRLEDEASQDANEVEFVFNEGLFEKASIPELEEQKISHLKLISEYLPEIKTFVLSDPSGDVKEALHEVEDDEPPEELAGFVSFASLQLKEWQDLLGLGELKAFAISSKKNLYAALCKEDEFLAMKGAPKKGLLWWSKKLLEARKKWKT